MSRHKENGIDRARKRRIPLLLFESEIRYFGGSHPSNGRCPNNIERRGPWELGHVVVPDKLSIGGSPYKRWAEQNITNIQSAFETAASEQEEFPSPAIYL